MAQQTRHYTIQNEHPKHKPKRIIKKNTENIITQKQNQYTIR